MAKKIFMIAGEDSGDNVGASLIKKIREKTPDIIINGIGGNSMQSQGLKSLFPMKEISLMGFLEILPHLPNLIKRINQTTSEIIDQNPESVVTIDSPGFNFRVVKKLRKKGFKGKVIHAVAPSVWAYKPERAKKCAKLFDHMLCILPWEPPYFKKEGLEATFIGHPLFEEIKYIGETEKNLLKEKYNIKKEEKLISLLPGSRKSEIKKLIPIYIETAKLLLKEIPNLKFAILATETLEEEVKKHLSKFPKGTVIESDKEEKRKILQISDAGIVKSGTISLEVAALGCPHLICYKVNPISAWLVKKMINIDFVNLINISANKEIIPELLQEKCRPKNITTEVLKILDNKSSKIENLSKQINLELDKMKLGKEIPNL